MNLTDYQRTQIGRKLLLAWEKKKQDVGPFLLSVMRREDQRDFLTAEEILALARDCFDEPLPEELKEWLGTVPIPELREVVRPWFPKDRYTEF